MSVSSDSQQRRASDFVPDKASPGNLREIARQIADNPKPTGIILDFDGTLAPIAPTPDSVALGDGGPDLLRRLLARFPVVAVISGRTLSDLQGRLGIDGLWLAGDHGAVVQSPHGEQIGAKIFPDLDGRLEQALARLRDLPHGIRVERKPRSLALHYRGYECDDALVSAVKQQATKVASPLGLIAGPGRCLVELRQPGLDKGAGVKIIAERNQLKAALVGGDDWTDLDAFRAVHELFGPRGTRVAVWSEEAPPPLLAEADAVVPGVNEMIRWLNTLVGDRSR